MLFIDIIINIFNSGCLTLIATGYTSNGSEAVNERGSYHKAKIILICS